MIKIAFLFLIINNVYHEKCWRDFFAGHEDQYSVYVHAKETVIADSFFKPYEMSLKIPTTWANTMHAQIALLKEALADQDNTKFLFVSESTIPIVDFQTAYTRITQDNKSIFYFEPNPHCKKPSRNLAPIPNNKQYKNPQWVILNRKHAQLMINDQEYISIITNYFADNEHYPSTFLLNQNCAHEIEKRETTYAEWHKKGPSYPYLFTNLGNPEELNMLLNAQKNGYLFARKIAKGCDLSPLAPYLPHYKSFDRLPGFVKTTPD